MFRSILTILRGTVLAQALGFLVLPILTRIFDPPDFGALQAYQATLGLLLMVAAFRYEVALLRCGDGDEYRATLQICVLAHSVSTTVVTICVCLALAIPDAVSNATARWLAWLPAGILVAGVAQTMSYVALRGRIFAAASNAKVAQSICYAATAVGAGTAGAGAGGLIAGDLVGRLASIAWMWRSRGIFRVAWSGWSTREALRAVGHKYREYPLVSLPGGLVNAAGGAMTGIFVYALFDISTAGQYGLFERGILIPLGMVGVAVSQVYTASLAERIRDGVGGAKTVFEDLVKKMFLISVLPAGLLAVAGPSLFGLVFGSQWIEAGHFAQLMSPWVLFVLSVSAVNMTIMVIGDQSTQLAWEIARLVLVAGVWGVTYGMKFSVQLALVLHSAVYVVSGLVYLWLAWGCVDRYDRRINTSRFP